MTNTNEGQMNMMTITLADAIRTIHANRKWTRKELKVARAKLRRLGVTCFLASNQPYALDVDAARGLVEDTSRCESPAIILTAIADAVAS